MREGEGVALCKGDLAVTRWGPINSLGSALFRDEGASIFA